MNTSAPQRFATLLSPIRLGGTDIRNRIVSTGHHTHLAHMVPNDALIAYHEARARGGVGLIVTEVTGVHPTALFSNDLLMATDDSCMDGFAKLAQAVHKHGATVFAQLFHPGRELLASTSGLIPAAYAPSAVPNERFHIMPRAMPGDLIEEIIAGYGCAAGYLAQAGYDGVEIVASHGYLPAQFLNPQVNLRDDAWGGDAERRRAFLAAVIQAIRTAAPDLTMGLRISGDEMDDLGLSADAVLATCTAFAEDVDYFSVVCGTSAGLGASVHIVPPMGMSNGYTAPYAQAVREATGKPVIATGRINQPQTAESILAAGQADMCGMTRALIADADLPTKTSDGRLDDIRACIACNQSCIGRAHKGFGISCLQHPPSGRETEFPNLPSAAAPKRVAVVGGGPGGMKAAATAALRGHDVTLFETASRLGGQALLAQGLPGREDFGGVVTNFEAELSAAHVRIETGTTADATMLQDADFDSVIVATGATPYVPSFEGNDAAHVVTAWDVIAGRANVGSSVVIADWRADWIGLGLAEHLASTGARVTLCTNAAMAGESLQLYTRNHYVGRLHALGVTIRTHARLFGVDDDTAYFQDTLTQEAIPVEGVETVVLALGHRAKSDLSESLTGSGMDVQSIGDCVAPRTAEEAIYEGYVAGREV